MTQGSSPRQGVSRRRFLTFGLTGFLGLFFAETAWYEPQALQIEKSSLATSQPGDTIRMIQISDLHLSRYSSYFKNVIRQVALLEPDLIVLTGDYLEEERNIRGVLNFLAELSAPHGIYAVQGNWEYWSRLEGENLRRHFSGVGVKLLINERADLQIRGQTLSLYGLDYPSSADFLRILQKEINPDSFNVLLSHVPAFSHEYLSQHMNLILSGHTHGGQIRLPLLPPFYLPRYSGRFVAGYYQVSQHKIPLYVSRGVGTSVLPLRFLCRPEISVFELRGGNLS